MYTNIYQSMHLSSMTGWGEGCLPYTTGTLSRVYHLFDTSRSEARKWKSMYAVETHKSKQNVLGSDRFYR